MNHFSSRKSLFWVANKQTEKWKITLESKIALGVQQNLVMSEQQTSLLIAMKILSLRPANFPQTVMWPFMLADLDHPGITNRKQFTKFCFLDNQLKRCTCWNVVQLPHKISWHYFIVAVILIQFSEYMKRTEYTAFYCCHRNNQNVKKEYSRQACEITFDGCAVHNVAKKTLLIFVVNQ